MLELARGIDDKPLVMELLAFRVYDDVALGDTSAWDHDLDAHQHLADEIGEPFYTYNSRAMQTAQAVNAGRLRTRSGWRWTCWRSARSSVWTT